jgi:hypothetical protein
VASLGSGARHRGGVRPRGGRERHERALGRALLPPAAPGRTHPHPREPRRLRGTRPAQRVRAPRPHRPGLRGQPDPRGAVGLQRRREGPAARPGGGRRPLRDRVRPGLLPAPRAGVGRVLRSRPLRRRPAGAHGLHRPALLPAHRGVGSRPRGRHREDAALGEDPGGSAAHPRSRPRPSAGRLDLLRARIPRGHQLPRLPGQPPRGGRGGAGAAPGPARVLLRRGDRGRLGPRSHGFRSAGCRQHEPGPLRGAGEARARLAGGALHPPLPGRQRLGDPAAGAAADPRRRLGLDHGGRGDRLLRLRGPRRAGLAGAAAALEHRGGGAPRRRPRVRRAGRRRLRAGRPGPAPETWCSPATT